MDIIRNFSPAAADARDLWQKYLSDPLLYPRQDEFKSLIKEVCTGLKQLLATESQPMLLSSAGTGALECAVGSLPVESKAVVIRNGYFGQRLYEIASFHLHSVHTFDIPFGAAFSDRNTESFSAFLEKTQADVVIAVHLESSSGLVNDVRMICSVAKAHGAFTIIDGISSAGALPCRLDEWGIDCFVASAYKALLCPAGLSFIIANDLFLKQAKRKWSYYFDIGRMIETAHRDSFLWSPNVLSLLCIRDIAASILTSGEIKYFSIQEAKAAQFRDYLLKKDIIIFGDPDFLSPCFTAIELYDNNADLWLSDLKERHGIIIGKGLGANSDRFLRIGHYPNTTAAEYERLSRAITETDRALKRR